MNYQGNPLYTKNTVLVKSFSFSVDVINFCFDMRKQGEYVLSKQLIRSATSIGANLREAQNAESRKDFIHKVKIALKEADETEYWLLLVKSTLQENDVQQLLNRLEELLKIMNAIISKLKKHVVN